MEKGVTALCVIRSDDKAKAVTMSPFTMRPCLTYRGAGIFSDFMQNEKRASELKSLLVAPFDTMTIYPDLSVIEIKNPMVALDAAMAEMRECKEEDKDIMEQMTHCTLIGAKEENIRCLGIVPEWALKSNDVLRGYLCTRI